MKPAVESGSKGRPDSADGHAGGAGEGDAGIVEEAASDFDPVARQIGSEVGAVPPILRQHEDRPEVLADRVEHSPQRLFRRAVGGELEEDVGALAVARADGVQARKMRSDEFVGRDRGVGGRAGWRIETVERGLDVLPRRVAEKVDRRFRVSDAVGAQRRDEG